MWVHGSTFIWQDTISQCLLEGVQSGKWTWFKDDMALRIAVQETEVSVAANSINTISLNRAAWGPVWVNDPMSYILYIAYIIVGIWNEIYKNRTSVTNFTYSFLWCEFSFPFTLTCILLEDIINNYLRYYQQWLCSKN